MEKTDPKLIILLLLVIAGYFALKAMNPYKKYSTQSYWESAIVADVDEIPAEALAPGNSNGPVLMWAATTTQDPDVIDALVARGAVINEVDGIFLGTPLSGAASYNSSTRIIDRLIAHGADISMLLLHNNSILQTAAMYNEHPGIIEHLLELGIDIHHHNDLNQNALDLAIEFENDTAIMALKNALNYSE
jgi:ankyrin repeat protein